VCVCVREYVRALTRGSSARPLDVYLYIYVYMSIYVYSYVYIEYRSSVAHLLVHARTDIHMHACIDGSVWTGVPRYACICLYIYITMSISLLDLYHVLICMHVRMYVGM
jgi:hypothetical protein